MEDRTKTIFIICGPTCTGKTSLALQLTSKHNAQIISADSRQIIKGMDIGTGKISVVGAEHFPSKNTPIYGYNLVEPDQYFSAFDFAQYALKKADEILQENKTVFVVGGTGFYIDMFTGRTAPANVIPDNKLRYELAQLSTEKLVDKLKNLNPEKLSKIDTKNNARLIRAIEIEVSPKSTLKLNLFANINFVYIGLTSSREVLYKRADAWFDTIWANGLIQETQTLQMQPKYAQKLKGLIYSNVVAFLNNQLSEEKAKQQAKFDLHAYIRRQQTYFKKNPDIIWFDIADPQYMEKIDRLMLKSN